MVGLPVDGKKKENRSVEIGFFIGLSKRYTVFNKSFQLALWYGIIKISMYTIVWVIFYEDSLVFLWGQSVFPENEFEVLKYGALFNLITNHIIFNDQYLDNDL